MKIRRILLASLLSVSSICGLTSIPKDVNASGTQKNIELYYENVQFTKIPDNSDVSLAGGLWDKVPWYSCNNVLVGANINNTSCYYKLLWDSNRIYFGIKAHDETPNDHDMIEIGIKYHEQHWGYIFATMAPWITTINFGNGDFVYVDGKYSDKQNREMYFAINLKDKSMLKDKEMLLMNMNYYDKNDAGDNIVRVQSGFYTSGDPSVFVPFAPSGSTSEEVKDCYEYIDEYYDALDDE